MNRLGMMILAILRKNSALSPSTAVSIYELKDYATLHYSLSTIYRTIQSLCEDGFINDGLKDSKANTFYITEKGLQIIKEMN